MKKIQLGGHRSGGVIRDYALVDDEDFEELNQYRWSVAKRRAVFYAQRNLRLDNKRVTVFMHTQIIKAHQGLEIDHIDGNGLNNQRSNLRTCTSEENKMNRGKFVNNTSGFKGVSWHKPAMKWRAQINANGKTTHLGLFATKELAYEAYISACIKYHGEFAHKQIANSK